MMHQARKAELNAGEGLAAHFFLADIKLLICGKTGQDSGGLSKQANKQAKKMQYVWYHLYSRAKRD